VGVVQGKMNNAYGNVSNAYVTMCRIMSMVNTTNVSIIYGTSGNGGTKNNYWNRVIHE
jgi:hypothetical protein